MGRNRTIKRCKTMTVQDSHYIGVDIEEARRINKASYVSDVHVFGKEDGFRVFFKRNDQKLVVNEDGSPVMYFGAPVYRYSDGRLFNTDGDPVCQSEQNVDQVYLNDQNMLVDALGRNVSDLPFGDSPIRCEPLRCVLIASNTTHARVIKSPATVITNLKDIGFDVGVVDINDWDTNNAYNPILRARKNKKKA